MPSWLFRRFIVRRSVRNPIRALLLIIAVSFATTLIASVYRVSVAGVESFEDSLGFSASEYPLAIVPRGGGIPLSDLGACLAPLRDSFAFATYRRVTGVLVTSRGHYALVVVGIGGLQDKGELPHVGEEIALSDQSRVAHSLALGDQVQVVLPWTTLKGAVGTSPRLAPGGTARGAIVPLSRLLQGAPSPIVDAILVRPNGDSSVERYRAALAEWMGSCGALSVPLNVEISSKRLEQSESLVAAYRFNVMIMAGMALLVCALLISQATQLSLRNLSRELSVLRTLGVGRVACLSSVILEGALLGVVGAFLGVTVGEPLTLWITQLFLQTAHDIYDISFAVFGRSHLLQAAIIVCGMVAVCVSGAAFGGIEALRITPALGTRSEHTGVRPISPRWAAGLAALSIGAFALIASAARFTDSVLLAYLFVAGCMGAAAGVTPYGILCASRFLAPLSGSILLWSARGGIVARGRSFLLGAVGASLSITLICALSLMVGSFRETLQVWTAQRLQGDLFVSSAIEGQGSEEQIPQDLEEKIRSLSDVRRVVPYFEVLTSHREMPLVVSASDIATQIERGVYVLRSGELNRELLASGRGALVSESAARKLRLSIGERFQLEGRELTIVAIVQDFGTEHPLLHIDRGLFNALYPGHAPKNLTIDISDGNSLEDVRQKVATTVGVVGTVRDYRELRALVLHLFDRTFQVTLSVRWIVFGLALLGLLLASIQHLWERRREVKTMHVLGFSPALIIGAHVLEVTVVCALPVFVGLCGGVALGWGLTALVNPRSFGWTLDFSFSVTPLVVGMGFLGSVALVVAIGTKAMLAKTIKEATLADE